jgi:hypothetical protein
MQQTVRAPAGAGGLGTTARRDVWWAEPLAVAVGLGLFGIYATWAALQGDNYRAGPYLSPFYSPLILADWWPLSPALLILWAPLGFRLTCYYYRKAYYRAYFMDPPACAVGEPSRGRYCGETTFPLVLQNLHRYFMYLSFVLLFFLWTDVVHAFRFEDGLGVGVGTLVLFANTALLTGYSLSCHSLRHVVGGCLDRCGGSPLGEARLGAWHFLSRLNRHHMLWAWTSLIVVGLADLYVRLVASGVIRDLRLL